MPLILLGTAILIPIFVSVGLLVNIFFTQFVPPVFQFLTFVCMLLARSVFSGLWVLYLTAAESLSVAVNSVSYYRCPRFKCRPWGYSTAQFVSFLVPPRKVFDNDTRSWSFHSHSYQLGYHSIIRRRPNMCGRHSYVKPTNRLEKHTRACFRTSMCLWFCATNIQTRLYFVVCWVRTEARTFRIFVTLTVVKEAT
jgi:hypothetical protein